MSVFIFISDKIQTIKKILSSRKGLSSTVAAGDTFEFEYVEAYKRHSEYDSRLEKVKKYLHGLLDDKIANWEVCKYDNGLQDNYWLYCKEKNSYFCEVESGAPRMEDYMITEDHFILMIEESYFVYLDGYFHVLDSFNHFSENHRYTINELRIPEELPRETVMDALRAAFQTYKINVSYFKDIDIELIMRNIKLYLGKENEKQTDVR